MSDFDNDDQNLNEAAQRELDAFFAEMGRYSKYPSPGFDHEPRDDTRMENSESTEPEAEPKTEPGTKPVTEPFKKRTRGPSAQPSCTVNQDRVSAVTNVILLSKDPSTLPQQDQTFASQQERFYCKRAFAAKTATDPSEFAGLKTEVERKVTTHIKRSERGKSQVKTLFQAITKPDTRTSLKGCPPGSAPFVRGIIERYRERMEKQRTKDLWGKIGGKCSEFVRNPDRVVELSDEE
jgi:hypothetical protein